MTRKIESVTMSIELTQDYLRYKCWRTIPQDVVVPIVFTAVINELKYTLELEYLAFNFYIMRDFNNNFGIAVIVEDGTAENIINNIVQQCLQIKCAIWLREKSYQREDERFHKEILESTWSQIPFTPTSIQVQEQIDGLTAIFEGPILNLDGFTFTNNSHITCPWIFTVFDGLLPAHFPALPEKYIVIQSDIRFCFASLDALDKDVSPMAGLSITKIVESRAIYRQSICHSIFVQKDGEDPIYGYLTTLHKSGNKTNESAWNAGDTAHLKRNLNDGNTTFYDLGKMTIPFQYNYNANICLSDVNYNVCIDFCIVKSMEQIDNIKPLVAIAENADEYDACVTICSLDGIIQIEDLIKKGGLGVIYKSGSKTGTSKGIHIPTVTIYNEYIDKREYTLQPSNITDDIAKTTYGHHLMLVYSSDDNFMMAGDSGGLCFTCQEINNIKLYKAVGMCIGKLSKTIFMVLPLCFIEEVFRNHGYHVVSWNPSTVNISTTINNTSMINMTLNDAKNVNDL